VQLKSIRGAKPIGPYSQAVRAGGLIFVSGQISVDPGSGAVLSFGDDAALQFAQIMRNLTGLLQDFDQTLADVIKTTLYLKRMEDFGPVNQVYAEVFAAHRPARTTIGVAALPANVLVELEAIVAASDA
jgi:2-iminobutanoate/2-iminopropanoate deaminase